MLKGDKEGKTLSGEGKHGEAFRWVTLLSSLGLFLCRKVSAFVYRKVSAEDQLYIQVLQRSSEHEEEKKSPSFANIPHSKCEI